MKESIKKWRAQLSVHAKSALWGSWTVGLWYFFLSQFIKVDGGRPKVTSSCEPMTLYSVGRSCAWSTMQVSIWGTSPYLQIMMGPQLFLFLCWDMPKSTHPGHFGHSYRWLWVYYHPLWWTVTERSTMISPFSFVTKQIWCAQRVVLIRPYTKPVAAYKVMWLLQHYLCVLCVCPYVLIQVVCVCLLPWTVVNWGSGNTCTTVHVDRASLYVLVLFSTLHCYLHSPLLRNQNLNTFLFFPVNSHDFS